MDNKINELLNLQINKEFYSAYLYWAMSAYFSEISMDGFAKYMRKQAKEELEHAQKIYDYLALRNEKITFARIEEPFNNWTNANDVISSALEHEIVVSNSIREIYNVADEQKDYKLTVELCQEVFDLLPQDKVIALKECLEEDPRPSYQDDGKEYGLTFSGINIKFTVNNGTLRVFRAQKLTN